MESSRVACEEYTMKPTPEKKKGAKPTRPLETGSQSTSPEKKKSPQPPRVSAPKR